MIIINFFISSHITQNYFCLNINDQQNTNGQLCRLSSSSYSEISVLLLLNSDKEKTQKLNKKYKNKH